MDSDSDNSDTAPRISKAPSASSKLKSRRDLPPGAVATLKAWLLSPQHFNHPYPSPTEQQQLMQKTGIDKKQLKNWFTNARRRIWKPMLKKQIDSGSVPPPPSLPSSQPYPSPRSSNYQQPYNYNPPYQQPYNQQTYSAPYPPQQPYQPSYQQPYTSAPSYPSQPRSSSGSGMVKTDSHAVLMELFTRDQELVRAAAEMKSGATQDTASTHRERNPSSPGGTFTQQWPNFTSVSSLTSMGGQIPGVKSITNLSAQDVKTSELKSVKSGGEIGRADSYAFLEVFFDKNERKSSSDNPGAYDTQGSDVGLSLDDDATNTNGSSSKAPAPTSTQTSAPLPKKRALSDVDDAGAMAARGLMSVSKSSENLNNLTLPAKMQKSLSQEFATNRLHLGFSSVSSNNYMGSTFSGPTNLSVTDPSYSPPSLPSSTKTCGICSKPHIDTQLQPCGHMFHGPCLRTSSDFKNMKCPKCGKDVESALLAVHEAMKVVGGGWGEEEEDVPSF